MRTHLARLVAAGGTAAALALGAPAGALAEPDGTLSSAQPTYEFAGGPGFGVLATSDVSSRVGCNPVVFQCDTYLVKVDEDAGDLLFEIAGEGQNTKDLDLHVYWSDADGTQGDLLGESTSEGATEAVSTGELEPGYYLVVVDYYLAVAGTYTGKVTFTPPAPE
jgi:hypothetical protein